MPGAPVKQSLRPRLIFWFIVFILLTAFSVVQTWSNSRFQAQTVAAQLDWNVKVSANAAAENHARSFFYQLCRSGHEPRIRDAELKFNEGRPFPTTQDGSTTAAIFTDPSSANPSIPGRALLSFHGETWSDVSPYFDDPRIGNMPDPNSGLFGTLTIVRRILSIVGYIAWLVIFCAMVIDRAGVVQKPLMTWAIDLLAIAIVSTTLALIGPNPRRAMFDFFQDDSAGWGLLAIAISLALWIVILVKPARPLTNTAPRCKTCGYDLTGNESGRCPECGTPAAVFSVANDR